MPRSGLLLLQPHSAERKREAQLGSETVERMRHRMGINFCMEGFSWGQRNLRALSSYNTRETLLGTRLPVRSN